MKKVQANCKTHFILEKFLSFPQTDSIIVIVLYSSNVLWEHVFLIDSFILSNGLNEKSCLIRVRILTERRKNETTR